jgi:hypothetical protein
MRRQHGAPPAEPRAGSPSGHPEEDILLGSHTIQHTAKNIYRQQRLDDDDDNNSVLSRVDSIPSVFSMKSATTSATGISSVNGYSSSDIATASKELFTIFQSNEIMLPLYKTALASPAIGPERLQRNLRRLFKAYSEHLKDEATDQMEYLSARLVAMESRRLAESIVANFRSGPAQLRAAERGEYSDSSNEEGDTRPVDEETLADLTTFRGFLVESQAFQTLQAQLQAFVAPKLPEPISEHCHDDKASRILGGSISRCVKPSIRENIRRGTWHLWRQEAAETAYACLCNSYGLPTTMLLVFLLVDLVFLTIDETLVSFGLLEPPLHPDKIRLRWSSVSDTLCPLI